ncbi:LOW QUALITY PROTEIN: uncharacterized protein LOC116256614 [Nymphaea colorata]|uniref:LOW QUALITY PROTEIN: uncharacterized protein LOC116256614 n=1 Tax=Nymphaea colorata TaxID=210225 RepID=UPI00129DDCEE|nr:LOW QUALITY PROTEIN: uncharacterized protein LOC116256614 [Nymphaea colorata]
MEQKLNDRLQCWQEKLLSLSDRITLAKHCLASVPLHALAVFRPPVAVLSRFNKLIRTVSHSLDLSEEEWNQTVNTNLKGTWFVSKSLCRLMHEANQGGSIVNISSIGGVQNRGALPGALAYEVSRAAIDALTKTMALEMGSHRIRVNSIAPRLFKSEIRSALLEKEWLNAVAEGIINPLRTFGTLDPALTSLLRYLIHDSSQYVTGNVFIVDVGASLAGLPIYSSL